MNSDTVYPIRFQPIFKDYLWGGNNLSRLFEGKEDPSLKIIAESWEIADLDADVSLVANGADKGCSLRQLLEKKGESLLGKQCFKKSGGRFPFLIKLIDAQKRLSLQVHPDDAYADKTEGGKRGKTELWYLVETQPGSQLMCGFKENVTAEDYHKNVSEERFENLVRSYPTHPGDVFFVPPGTIHAIDKGNILFEIQTASDLTYRIYDWGRKDAGGRLRPTHREKAGRVLRFDNPSAGKVEPVVMEQTEGFTKTELIKSAPFRVEKWELSRETPDMLPEDQFAVYCFVSGSGVLKKGEPAFPDESFLAGNTYLIPASLHSLHIVPEDEKGVTLLKVTPHTG